MQEELKKLHELLQAHKKLEDDVDLENILELLPSSVVYVAGVDPEKTDVDNKVYEEDLLKKLDIPFWPDLLTDSDGNPFFPAFTDKQNAPGELKEPFEWIEIPFLKLCYFAAHTGITSEIILEPFTDCLELPVSLVLQYSGRYQDEHPGL